MKGRCPPGAVWGAAKAFTVQRCAVLVVLFVAACAAQPQAPTTTPAPAPAPQLSTGRPVGITAEGAFTLVDDAAFDSAKQLGRLRPKPLREIAAFDFALRSDGDSDGKPMRSTVEYLALPDSLRYVLHRVVDEAGEPVLDESAIDVFGASTVMMWNSRSGFEGRPSLIGPDQLTLAVGKLFGPFAFAITSRSPGGHASLIACAPARTAPAATLHPDLTGAATLFTCALANSSVVAQVWYLADAAIYFEQSSRDGDELSSDFRITAVRYRP